MDVESMRLTGLSYAVSRYAASAPSIAVSAAQPPVWTWDPLIVLSLLLALGFYFFGALAANHAAMFPTIKLPCFYLAG